MRLAIVIVLAIVAPVFIRAQGASSWPVDAGGNGGFSARRLAAVPAVDGRAWIRADIKFGQPPTWRPAKGDYALRFADLDEEGDIARWALILERPGARPVSLSAGGKTGFAYVTPDARFIFTEPLMAIDVRRWERYALHSALGIQPYVSIEAISRDGRRLLVSSRICAFDCRNEPVIAFEVTLPS